MKFKWLFSIVLSFAFLFTAPALAHSPIDKEAALDDDFRSLIGNARDAFDASDYEAAVEYLVIANHINSEPRLFHNIARSHEEMGNCQKSLAYYRAYLEDPPDDDALIERARKNVEEGGPECDEFHDELGGRLVLESSPKLVTVYLDDQVIGLTPTETAGLEPGAYTVRFELEGYQDYTTDIEVMPNQSLEVRAALDEIEEPPATDEIDDIEPVQEPVSASDDDFRPNPIALGLVGVGTAGAITGMVYDLVLIPGVDERREEARANSEPQRAAELTEQRDRYATIAVASYISGAVIGLGGLAWIGYDYYHFSDDEDDSPFSWQLAPTIDAQQTGLSIFGQF